MSNSKRPDRIPAIDPATPGIYRQIIETADALRKLQQLEIEVRLNTASVLNTIRMRAAAEVADAELDRQEQRRKARSDKAKTIYRHRVVRCKSP